MERLQITKGEWEADGIDVFTKEFVSASIEHIAQAYDGKDTSILDMDTKIAEANAILIADAGTTYNECDKLPSQLLSENKELLECLEYWKTRCLLMEAVEENNPCDPDTTQEQILAWTKYKEFLTINGMKKEIESL